jgi:hypothetical protein
MSDRSAASLGQALAGGAAMVGAGVVARDAATAAGALLVLSLPKPCARTGVAGL